MTPEELEAICMEIISETGEGRTHIFNAIESLVLGNFDACKSSLDIARSNLERAHRAQFMQLMRPQAQGETVPFHLLLIHAMDLLMVTSSEMDLTQRLYESLLKRQSA